MSNQDMAAAIAAKIVALLSQGVTVPASTKPVKARKAKPKAKRGKAKAKPKAEAKPKEKKGATDAQRAYFNALKVSNPCPFRPGMVEINAYRAAKAAGLVG
jgi:hypothetical protein